MLRILSWLAQSAEEVSVCGGTVEKIFSFTSHWPPYNGGVCVWVGVRVLG